jgi:hypothetical protein
MRKKLFGLIMLILLLPLIAGAITIENPLQYDTIPEIITAVCDFIFWIAIPITGLAIILLSKAIAAVIESVLM